MQDTSLAQMNSLRIQMQISQAFLTTWIADESRVTRNKMILEQIATKDVTAMKDLDDIKKALNITLGQAFKTYFCNCDKRRWVTVA